MNRIVIILFTMMLVIDSVFSQTDVLRAHPGNVADSNRAGLRFERNIFTYSWNFDGAVAHQDSVISVNVADQFTSSLITNNFRSVRDENTFAVNLSHAFSEQWSLESETRSFILSDNQSLGVSNAGIHSALAGVSFHPIPSIMLTPLVGVRYDKQQDKSDDGFTVKLSARADSLDASGYRAAFIGELNQSDLSPRKFANNVANLGVATDFGEGSSDSIRIRWLNNRWDFYVPADSTVQKAFGVSSNIRSRAEQIFGVQNFLLYNIGEGFFTQLSTVAETHKISNAFRYKTFSVLSAIPFNTTVQEFRLEGGLDVRYRSSGFISSIGMQVSERDEKHLLERISGIDDLFQQNRAELESRLDNTALRTTLQSNFQAMVSANDNISFDGSASLLRYDTPDSLNTDDRDELLINASLRERHRLSTLFEASVTAEATLAHSVYLLKDKSANNNWNRIFRLSPELSYTPSEQFRMFNAFEVLANYTVFDFETMIPSVKSYVYRQVAFLDSSSYDITPTLGCEIFAHVRIFERGELKWDDFSERPLQYIQEVTFFPQVRYRYAERWMFAVGFRSFAQKRFRHENNERLYEGTFLSAGPTTHIMLNLAALSQIEIIGWKEFQYQSGQKIQEFSNIAMTVRYFF